MIQSTRQPRRGFTLIEILCVVVILGIASALIIPQIGTRSDLQAAASARSIMADLIYAQNRAIATQRWQFVRFDTANNRYTLSGENAAGVEQTLTHPTEKSPYVVRIDRNGLEGCRLDAVDFNARAAVAFDALGSPHAVAPDNTRTALTSGSVRVAAGSFGLTVSVEPYTGELSVQ